ncbi:MAG: hypothetical protein II942_04330 [Alphaproteobacteria bacterium]|nr:hypothetical protein [Alphaproteobacteria bacterium]
MSKMKKLSLFIAVGALSFTASLACAQAKSDILVFDNTSGDFLLPSYFDQQPTVTLTTDTNTQNIPADIDIIKEIFGDNAQTSLTPTPASDSPKQASATKGTTNTQTFYPRPKELQTAREQKQPLLTPLPPLPKPIEPEPVPPARLTTPSPYASKVLAKETGTSKGNVTLPKDIRLQFEKNAMQLTETAIKWISAYALHIKKDPRLVAEVRVSRHDWPIQKHRLALIMQTFIEKGLAARQIHVYHSDRDPDTMVIGYQTDPNQTKIVTPEYKNVKLKEQKTLSW